LIGLILLYFILLYFLGAIVGQTTTNGTGFYLFCGLFPSLTGYKVTFVTPNNYVFTACQKAGKFRKHQIRNSKQLNKLNK
jgi:hypothetical protein